MPVPVVGLGNRQVCTNTAEATGTAWADRAPAECDELMVQLFDFLVKGANNPVMAKELAPPFVIPFVTQATQVGFQRVRDAYLCQTDARPLDTRTVSDFYDLVIGDTTVVLPWLFTEPGSNRPHSWFVPSSTVPNAWISQRAVSSSSSSTPTPTVIVAADDRVVRNFFATPTSANPWDLLAQLATNDASMVPALRQALSRIVRGMERSCPNAVAQDDAPFTPYKTVSVQNYKQPFW